jgi:outer membrane receptor protein involved in Fe transport
VEIPAGSGNYESYTNPMDHYHVFDLGLEQTLYQGNYIKKLQLGFYVNNLLNTSYENERGYPMTDRTFIGSLKASF